MKILFPNSFLVHFFFVSKRFFEIYVEMVANVQKINKHIGNFMVKMKLLGIYIRFYFLRLSRSFCHFSTLFEKEHKHFWHGFFIETPLFHKLRDIFLKIAECRTLFKIKVVHIVSLTFFKLSSSFVTRDCKTTFSSSDKLFGTKSGRYNFAIFPEPISFIESCRNTFVLKNSCALN